MKESEFVELFLIGFSNAFLMFLTLICPNPGRFCNWSEVAFAIFEKLWKWSIITVSHTKYRQQRTPNDVRRVSTSVLFTLLMLVNDERSIEL